MYLYLCTLKKHLKRDHVKEYQELSQGYNKRENFNTVFKELSDHPSKFDFLNFKRGLEIEKRNFNNEELRVENISLELNDYILEPVKTTRSSSLQESCPERFTILPDKKSEEHYVHPNNSIGWTQADFNRQIYILSMLSQPTGFTNMYSNSYVVNNYLQHLLSLRQSLTYGFTYDLI